jgi:hypothetical protein
MRRCMPRYSEVIHQQTIVLQGVEISRYPRPSLAVRKELLLWYVFYIRLRDAQPLFLEKAEITGPYRETPYRPKRIAVDRDIYLSG